MKSPRPDTETEALNVVTLTSNSGLRKAPNRFQKEPTPLGGVGPEGPSK